MTVITATVCSRALGDELRRLRETCTDLGGAQMATRLGWHPSKVTNIEKGKARASEIDLVQYLTMCGKDIVRIVPLDVVVPSSGCVLWEYEKSKSVAFSETDLAHMFVQDPGAIARTRLLFDHLAEVALDAEQPRRKLAEYVSPPRQEFDGRGPRLA